MAILPINVGTRNTGGTPGPKGDKGDTGEQGLQGEQGIQGEKGDKGDTGSQGVQGIKGDTGNQGIQGVKGDTGLQGIQGIQGVKGDKGDTGATGAQGASGITSVRNKSECYFSGLSLVIPTTATNLINLIKALPHTGSLSPFFNTTTNKFTVFNHNTTVTFKINIVGSWSGASTNRSMTVAFPNTQGNTLVASRDAAVTTDILSFPTFFSVDLNGNLATNGSDITIQSNGATFTATAILIIAEQAVPTS